MGIIYWTLLQESQTTRPSTAILVLVGLLILGALALAVYLFRRFKASAKEIEEEDWTQGRHTLLLDVEQPAKSAVAVEPGVTDILVSPPKERADAAGSREPEVRLGVKPESVPVPGETKTVPVLDELRAAAVNQADSGTRTEPSPQPPAAPTPALSEQPAATLPLGQSPLSEEIWAQLDKEPQVDTKTMARVSASVSALTGPAELRATEKQPQVAPPPERTAPRPTGPQPAPQREPFEPPRIEPILPRKLAQDKAIISPSARPVKTGFQVSASPTAQGLDDARLPKPQLPYAVPPALTGEISRSRRTTFDAGVAVVEPPGTREVEIPGAVRTPAGKKAGGSILGLPSTPSDKPLVLGQVPEAIEVNTLSSYGQTPKEKGGNGGTIFLAVVVGIVALLVGSYLFVPRIHNSVNAWSARVRGTDIADQTPKAQIFTGPQDNTQSPIKVSGSVQNVSSDNLSGLKVVVSFQASEAGTPNGTVESPVTPDPLAPGQQGSFQFELDPKTYKGFRVAGLKSGDGKDVPYTTPAQP